MSVSLQIAQTLVGNIGSSYVRTLFQPPFKFFAPLSPKESGKNASYSYSNLIPNLTPPHAHESDGGAAEGEIPKAGGDKVACAAGDGIDLAVAEKLALAADAEQMAH